MDYRPGALLAGHCHGARAEAAVVTMHACAYGHMGFDPVNMCPQHAARALACMQRCDSRDVPRIRKQDFISIIDTRASVIRHEYRKVARNHH